jgi:DNA mismatch endonuclease (patch repair protein)
MAYRFKTTKQRSLLMRKIKSSRTIPEITLQKFLRKEGFKFKINYRNLPGNPDIVMLNKKIAIFVDGEFWHGYRWEEKKKKIKGNRAYWIPKIERTIARDKGNNKILRKAGWRVVRFWQYQIAKDLTKCINKIKKITKRSLK